MWPAFGRIGLSPTCTFWWIRIRVIIGLIQIEVTIGPVDLKHGACKWCIEEGFFFFLLRAWREGWMDNMDLFYIILLSKKNILFRKINYYLIFICYKFFKFFIFYFYLSEVNIKYSYKQTKSLSSSHQCYFKESIPYYYDFFMLHWRFELTLTPMFLTSCATSEG